MESVADKVVHCQDDTSFTMFSVFIVSLNPASGPNKCLALTINSAPFISMIKLNPASACCPSFSDILFTKIDLEKSFVRIIADVSSSAGDLVNTYLVYLSVPLPELQEGKTVNKVIR